ncbi:uncharacterized protein LOC119679307 [Teleopsis dalmanni]|uniref:uncharacterized protein LOC119679307 n=1 Tax=Teleopsis dalmanni TaxID=139649 RepID=UPI0018CD4FDD|nr:uncharacterized protein LOC119679307 [Teleopsis dalmanni]
MDNSSCVETPAAPDWLLKLEDRREKLKQSKLGHEAGAGSKCNECGDKCPGLDLHFWRKVCRNCKCRKDQHMCGDDNFSGWAQFEILGQIRSKPAFIKIKALASQPLHLDWVPPNTKPDIVSDYMEKLGSAKIPVAGSYAAVKRKQQLEYQVPPHDLDAALCDNLTDGETKQLQQYVQKIRENCVGQGNVVRIGVLNQGFVTHMPQAVASQSEDLSSHKHFQHILAEVPDCDVILSELLASDKLKNAIANESPSILKNHLIVFQTPICETSADFENEPLISAQTKQKLSGLNKSAVCSLVKNGAIYDKVLAALQDKNIEVSYDPRLNPIKNFRKEYLQNPAFKNEMNAICSKLEEPNQNTAKLNNLFNSPLPLKCPVQTRISAQMRQDTPLRKVKFGGVSPVINYCDLPDYVDYEKDPIFAKIINATPLKVLLESNRVGKSMVPMVISQSPLIPNFSNESALSLPTKNKLSAIGVDKTAVQSVFLNAPYYERLFNVLDEKDIVYNDCELLMPLHQLHQLLHTDPKLYGEVRNFIENMPFGKQIAYGNQTNSFRDALKASGSNDSGFDSKSTTPQGSIINSPDNEINANSGIFKSIPGIEDMNMYPTVEAGVTLPNMLQNMHLSKNFPDNEIGLNQTQVPEMKCRDCDEAIKFGDVAVKAARAGREIAWHPNCFKCYTCRELLADLVYFFHGGQVYCGRDLAIKLKIPRCKACDELIFTKEYTAAENSTYHIKHFCCYQCDKPLAGEQYVPDDKTNMPICLECYKAYFAVVCESCQKAIGATEKGVGWKNDLRWHEQCFKCANVNCGKSLLGARFVASQDKPFCSPNCLKACISN